MKIAILGSGGREHAIAFKISKSHKKKKIYCIPGNAGTHEIAENIDLDINNFELLKEFIKKNNIDIIIIGPEKPLVEGIVDFLENNKIKVFGPNKLASKLEGSKIFTKNLCKKYNIPTAKFGVFKNIETALNFLLQCKFPLVIKADGLAAGKGVYICENKNQGEQAIKEIFNGKFGKANELLIEEFLKGEEMSFFTIHDGKTFKCFSTAQDHKRVYEGDKGKNTGGMGAYSPSRLINAELKKKIINKIIVPTLEGLNQLGCKYKGFLYTGLMIVKNEPYLIEYNVRMGDPECQTILPKLKTDLFDIIEACVNEKLKETNIEWLNNKSLCVVLCSNGYPDNYKKNIEIKNLNNISLGKDEFLFHAGTSKQNNKIYAVGGRVLNFVSLAKDFNSAKKNTVKNLENLNWLEGFYRRDIGHKVTDK